ncbi:proton-conducting transporter membrane subunit [Nocardioides sp. SOB77]|uniref:Proton-conducting transporter membrane subunit n=1 Tax=Nocardioides oceani TaxID=3058369 RepID=A0ABT8FMD9_9ACTN|nr:proton-conducting transporter membrane subunit [Nocardioides oceani]MDN4175799.1 proton-conducting transporter membrane subunit [Nocardioides oceani]
MTATMAGTALWLMVLLPAVVGGVLAVFRLDRAAVAVSISTATATGVLSVVVALTRPVVSVPFMAGSDFALGIDALSALVAPTVAFVTLLVLIFSAGEIHASQGRLNGLMLLFASAALVTVAAQTLPTLLLAWEVMGATSFALIGFWWREDRRVSAGVTAFLTTRTADVGLYVAAGAALAGGAGWALADLASTSAGWRHVLAAGVLVAGLGKAAQLPFSFWLSRAMEGPSPVSALLHSAAMVALGGYLLLRMEPLLTAAGWAAPTTAWIGALTALMVGAVAVGQRDAKQLLAASTSAQLGFVVMAAGLGAVSGGAAHLVAHAFTKALLFLAAGAWLTALGTKQLAGLHGVARRWRLVGWTATVAGLSLAGVAPLALWATKDAVLAAALEESLGLYAVGFAAAALSAAYAGKLLVVIWHRVPDSARVEVESHLDEEQPGTGHVGVLEKAPLLVLAVGAAVLGLLTLPPVGETVAQALGEQPPHASLVELLISAVVALLVLGLVWWRPVPEPRWALTWLGLDHATQAVVVRPTLGLAARLAWFDDRVLDSVVTGSASTALSVSRRAARFDDRVLDSGVEATSRASLRVAERSSTGDDRWVDGAVEGLATWLRGLGRLARRPQTGQLHQYYIQAVAVLAIGVLLLVTVR